MTKLIWFYVCIFVGEGKILTPTRQASLHAFLIQLKRRFVEDLEKMAVNIPGYTFQRYLGKGAFGAALLVQRNLGKIE